MDLVTNEERKTYLIYGDTGEIFRYQPFSCVTLKDHSDDLGVLAKMFRKFNLNQNNKNFQDTFIFGLGPLWMLSDTSPTKQYLKAKEKPTKTRPDLYNYHRFTVSIDQDSSDKESFPFDLNFYFSVNDKAVEKSKSESNQNIGPIEMFEWIDDDNRNVARAKVVYLDTSIDDKLLSSLFSIPEGYGCIRNNLDQKLGKSSNFMPIGFRPSHQMSIEVSASIPSKETTQWTTHTATVKFIRGSLGAGDTKYQIMETQERDDDVEPPLIKRVKKIWEYLSLNHNILYVIDEETNECTFSKVFNDNDAAVEFASTSNTFPTEIKLDLDTLNDLFITNDDDYHLIKDLIQPDNHSRVYVHERPIQKFTAGSISGPASIVRTSVHAILNDGSNSSPPDSSDSFQGRQYKNSAVIFIYTSDRRRLLSKLTFRLFDHRLVDSVILHKQLNIKNCLDESKSQYATIKYPLESPKISSLIAMKTNFIYNQFLTRMLNVMHLQPTNLNKIVINFDNYYIYIRMLILDTPSKLLTYTEIASKIIDINFMEKSQQELTGVDVKRHVSGSADKCADICDAYQCRAFSYCNNRKCIIYSKSSNTVDDTLSSLYKEDPKCRIYVDEYNLVKHDNKPHHVIERIREIIKNVVESTAKNVDDLAVVSDQYEMASRVDYLSIYVPINKLDEENIDGMELVSLTPVAIETDLIDIDDYFKDLKHNDNQLSLSDGPISTQHWLQDKLVHAEYTLELEAQRFELPIVDVRNQYSQANHITYEDCSILCQSNNCLSFSYCEADQSCVISNLHNMEIVETEARKDPHCNIFIRDYLSKFEKIPRVKRPYKSKWNLKANSPRECAMNCMDSKTRNCLSFEFCSSPDENNANCYLHSFHGKSMTTEYDINSEANYKSDKAKSARPACDRYSSEFSTEIIQISLFCFITDYFTNYDEIVFFHLTNIC